MGIRDSYSAQFQLNGIFQNSQSEFHFDYAHGGYPPHALMVEQQRMQGAPNVTPCMRLAEEVLSHFDLLCQSALTQKNGVCCKALYVSRYAELVLRATLRCQHCHAHSYHPPYKKEGADKCRLIALV